MARQRTSLPCRSPDAPVDRTHATTALVVARGPRVLEERLVETVEKQSGHKPEDRNITNGILTGAVDNQQSHRRGAHEPPPVTRGPAPGGHDSARVVGTPIGGTTG